MIKKLFIKDYNNTEDVHVRNRYGKVAGLFGIVTNLMLGMMKLVIGLISHSVSIMADAVNNILDTTSSLFTLIGFKLASKKPDKYHPYGYARYEYVTGLLIAMLMLVMGVIFAKESILKIIFPEQLSIDAVTFTILCIAILIKVVQIIVYLDFSKSINSSTLKTTAMDARNDVISTSGILAAMVIMKVFDINIDGYIGVILSGFVIFSSFKMVREVLEPLIGIVPSEKRVKEITDRLKSYDYVLGYHDLIIHNYGVGIDYVTIHIEIDSNLSMLDAHDLIDAIENDIKEELGISITIHMDPVVVGDSNIIEIKNMVESAIKQFDKDLTIHDFRVVDGNQKNKKILFDCVVPYEKNYTEEDIIKHLQNIDVRDDIKYTYIIEIDRPYC